MTAFTKQHCEIVTPVVAPSIDRRAWLQMRRTGIGSSDCSAVLGMSKYSTPYLLWRDKTGRDPLDAIPQANLEAIEWGTILEPVIRQRASERLGLEVTTSTMLRSTLRPWQLCDPDGIVGDAVVEIKNTSAWLSSDWDGQVPDHAELQVNHAMAVTGAAGAHVWGLIGGNRLVTMEVDRNERLVSLINEAEEEFWFEHVVADVEPVIDGSDATRAAILGSAEPTGQPVYADDPDAVRRWIAQYEAAAAQEKSAKADKAEARNNLLRLLDGGTALLDQDGVELCRIKAGTFAPKQFEAAFPEIADVTRKKIDVLDVDALKREHTDEYRMHQSVAIHIPKPKKGK